MHLRAFLGTAIAVLLLVWLPGRVAAAAPHDDVAKALRAQGQRMYREGLRPSGSPLNAIGAAQAVISGKEAACMTCHRRSGFGTSEGRINIRPITGPALLQESTVPVRSPRIKARLGSSVRPAYTEALLARALRTGVDASGKPLAAVMPRYEVSDEEVRAMAAYLFSLSAQASPGVDDQDIHFATVIQPGVAPELRRAMLDVMQAFVRDKDSNMRQDEQRRAAGNMRMYRAYRKWVLHVWELQGSSDTWGAQLEDLYRQQPVFALLGGLGTSSWQPIQDFSERLEIPTVLPQVDVAPQAQETQYTFYFSRGVVLEAEVLARYFSEQGGAGRIVQVYRPGHAGASAAAALRQTLAGSAAAQLEDLQLEGASDAAFWRRVAELRPAALVLWLDGTDLEHATLPRTGASVPVYLSFQLTRGQHPDAARLGGADLRLVYPSDLPPRHDARLLRSRFWLHNKGLGLGDETVQVNTLFTMTIVSDVIGHLADSFSRDYFVERLEHVVGQTPVPSIFPQVSLGPGQRYAAKGAQVVQLAEPAGGSMKALSGWIVP